MASPLFLEFQDEYDGRELVVAELDDSWVRFSVYRPRAVTSQYAVDIPPQGVVRLAVALAAHAHGALGVDELRGPEGGR